MALLIIFVAVLAATFTPSHRHDVELGAYYKDYMDIVSEYCSKSQLHLPPKTRISFVETFNTDRIIGQCGRAMSFWKISILRSQWRQLDQEGKTELMFHELSHCILEKDHVENPWNYMYNSQSRLSVEVIRAQVREDAWNHCITN